MQIDDTVWRLSAILRKARSIKNHFAPINKIPPETLALAATFLPTERDLINATAVCQQWRATLLYFPQLWRNPGGPPSKLEAYLERSKAVPIEVSLSYPQLVVSVIPHTFRLAALTVHVVDSLEFEEITEHLHDPIPTLRSLEVRVQESDLYALKFPSGLDGRLFPHLNTLTSNAIPSFRGPNPFPHITELSLCTDASPDALGTALLDALQHLPGLVKVSLKFQEDWYTNIDFGRIVTLPCVQEMHLCTAGASASTKSIPPILQFLKLPKVTSVTLRSGFPPMAHLSILPLISFHEQLPNYVELPELRIDTASYSGTAVFRSSSQAVFTYHTGILRNYHERERLLWGALPLSSVRRVTAILVDPQHGGEDGWLVDLLGYLDLELLELGGDCGRVLRRLRRNLARDGMGIAMWIGIKTLIVRGGEHARTQAVKFESTKYNLGLQNMTVTYIPDHRVHERDPGVSDDDWDDDLEEY